MVNREYVTLSGDLPFKQNDKALAVRLPSKYGCWVSGLGVNVNTQDLTSESDFHSSKKPNLWEVRLARGNEDFIILTVLSTSIC